MKNGKYATRFVVDRAAGESELIFRDGRLTGSDHGGSMDCTILHGHESITGVMSVFKQGEHRGSADECYSYRLFGISTPRSFAMIASGPDGVVVELVGNWTEPLDVEDAL